MNSYALILTYNSAYLPAMCALLNALDYYGHKDLDVHLLYTQDLSPVLEKAKNAGFCFHLETHPAEPLFNPGQGVYMNLMFIKYSYVQLIWDEYDAICHLDGDVLLLNDIMPYFTIAARTGLIPCAEFPHTMTNLDFFKTMDPDTVAVNYPMANFPVFYRPALHLDMMQYIWERMPAADNADRARNNEMYLFNYALWACRKIPFILPLPGNLWVGDKHVPHQPIRIDELAGVLGIYTFMGDRVNIIHNKYWKEGVAATELERAAVAGPEILERMRGNIKTIQDATQFFNTRCKLKLASLLS